MQIVDQEADLWPYAGPGHWNDPDMLWLYPIRKTVGHGPALMP